MSDLASAPLRQAHRRFVVVTRQRRLLLPKAVLVGLLAGLMAVAFHVCLDVGEDLRSRLVDQAHSWGTLGMAAIAGFSTVSILLAAGLVRRFAPEAGGSGIPHVKAVLQGSRGFRWRRVLLVKFVGGLIGISGGLALGREGPTVQMGAAVGEGLSALTWVRRKERKALLLAGAGAGLSAAFNSPLAGVIFVLEELQGRFASREFFASTLACLAADMVCRAALGPYPVFHIAVATPPDLRLSLVLIPLGVLAGFFGVAFNQTLLATQRLAEMRPALRLLWWLALGVMLGAVGWLEPSLLGGGQRFLESLLENGVAASSVALFFLLRFLLTLASYSTGAAGGIFSPILVLGALLGLLAENIVHWLLPQLPLEPNLFAVAGMAAYFTGVVRAPLTGIVLMIEMTGNYELVMPLFLACFSATLIADELNDLPIYEALLERGLTRPPSR